MESFIEVDGEYHITIMKGELDRLFPVAPYKIPQEPSIDVLGQKGKEDEPDRETEAETEIPRDETENSMMEDVEAGLRSEYHSGEGASGVTSP